MDIIKPISKEGRIGLFFGSFNPITNGHIDVAKKTLDFGLDELWFVVSPHNPHKYKKGILANEVHRWKMTQIAVCQIGEPKINASNIEFFLEEQPSYTHNTLQQLERDNPDAELIIVCGTDTHHKIQIWKESKYIHENFKFLVFPRGQSGHKIVKNTTLHKNSIYMDVDIVEASSTNIRNKIKSNNNITSETLPEVISYIEKNNVYEFVKNKKQ